MSKVTNYLKNLRDSVEFAAVEIGKDLMPNMNSFYVDNKETANSLFNDIRNIKVTLNKVSQSQDRYIFKPINFLIDNVKKDLKSGQFYGHEDRASAYMMEDMMSSMLDDMEDIEDEANGEPIENPQEGRVHGVPEVTKGDLVVAKTIGQSITQSSNAVANVIAKSADANFQLTKTTNNLQLQSLQKQTLIMVNGFGNLTNGIKSVLEFNDKVVQHHFQNSKIYYEHMVNYTAENNAILKEMLEMQRDQYNIIVGSHADKKNNDSFNSIFQNGKFNLKEYFKVIRERAKETPIGNAIEMTKMLPMMAAAMLFSNPLGFVTKQVLSTLIDTTLKTTIKKFDKTLSGFVTTALGKMFDYGKKNGGILGTIAKIFGVKSEKFSLSDVDTSKYNKGAMSWNGIAQKALIEVIPGHLRRIESAITGDEERFFDLDSGKWSSVKVLKKKQKQLDQEAANYVFENEIKEFKTLIRELLPNNDKASNKKRGQMRSEAKDLFRTLNKKSIYSSDELQELIKNGDKSVSGVDPSVLELVRIIMDKDHSRALEKTGRSNEFESKRNDQLSDQFQYQNSLQTAINGSINNKYINSRNNATSIGEAFLTKDKDNKNILDYSRIIAIESKNIRELLKNGVGPGKRKKKNNHINFISEIEDPWNDSFNQPTQTRSERNTSTEENSEKYENERNAKRLLLVQSSQNTNTSKLLGTSSSDIQEITKNINIDDPEQMQKVLIAINAKLKKQAAKNDSSQKDEGMINKLFENLGLKSNEDLTKKLEEAKGTLGLLDTMKSVNIAKMPQAVLSTVLSEANEMMYDVLFKKNTKEKDKNGNPITGFWGKMTHELENGMDIFSDHVRKGLIKLFDPKNGVLKTLNGVIEKITGLDVGKTIGKFKEKVKGYASGIGHSVINTLKDQYGGIKDSFVETFNDVKQIMDSQRAEANAFGKLVTNVPGTVITALSPGEAVIPAPLNPWNKNRKFVNPEQQESKERNTISQFKNGLKSTVGSLVDEYSGPGASKLAKFKTNATGTTGDEEQDKNQKNQPSFKKKILDFLRLASKLGVKSGKGLDHGIDQVVKNKEFQELIQDPNFQENITKLLANRNLINNGWNTDKATFNRESVTKMIKAGGYKGKLDTEEESRKKNYANNSSIWNNINQFMNAAFGTDIKRASATIDKTITKNLPEIGKGGTIGAALSTVFPLGGPLMGAMLGTSIAMIKRNKSAMSYLFGKELENGERDNSGLISNKFMKAFQKYVPDIKKYGTVGALSGLILPFGPLGGLIAGVGASYIKNNEGTKRFLFGDNDGIFDKNLRQKMKKAFPKMAAGAIAGMFLGPFGILGNAAIGAGLGMFTTTNSFKNILLGRMGKDGVRRGGLADILRRQIVDPFKKSMKDLSGQFAKWFKDGIFNPIARGLKPMGRYLANSIKDNVVGGMKRLFFKISEESGLNKISKKMLRGVENIIGGVKKTLGITTLNPIKGLGNLLSKGAKKFQTWSENKFIKANFEKGYNNASSFDEDTINEYEQNTTEEERAQNPQYQLAKMVQKNRNAKDSATGYKNIESLRDTITKYQNITNEDSINAEIRVERDAVNSTGEDILNKYYDQHNSSDLTQGQQLEHDHVEPGVLRREVHKYTDAIEQLTNIDTDDVTSVAEKLQILETKLKEEKENYKAYFKQVQINNGKADSVSLYRKLKSGKPVHKPRLSMSAINALEDLLKTSGKKLMQLKNAKKILHEDPSSVNAEVNEIIKQMGEQLGADTSTEEGKKNVENMLKNTHNKDAFNKILFDMKEEAKQKDSITKAQGQSEKTQSEVEKLENGIADESLQALNKQVDELQVIHDLMTGKIDSTMLDKETFTEAAKEIVERYDKRNNITDSLVENIQKLTDSKYQADIIEKTTEGFTGKLLNGLERILTGGFVPALNNGHSITDSINTKRKESRFNDFYQDNGIDGTIATNSNERTTTAVEPKTRTSSIDETTDMVQDVANSTLSTAKNVGKAAVFVTNRAVIPAAKAVDGKIGVTEVATDARDIITKGAVTTANYLGNKIKQIPTAINNAIDDVYDDNNTTGASPVLVPTIAGGPTIQTHAFGTLGKMGLNAGKSLGGKLISSLTGSDDKKEATSTTEEKPSVKNGVDNDKTTSDELKTASESISQAANESMKVKGEDQKTDRKNGSTWFTSDSEGNPIAMTTGPDGTPMKVQNKDNAEIEKKHEHELSLKERSTNALEDIASKVGSLTKDEASGLAKKAGGSLLDLLSKGLGGIAGLMDSLFLGLPIGTFLIGKLKKYLGKAAGKIGDLFKKGLSKISSIVKEKIGAGIKTAGKAVSKPLATAGSKILSLVKKNKKAAVILGIASALGFGTSDAEAEESDDDTEDTENEDQDTNDEINNSDNKEKSNKDKTSTEQSSGIFDAVKSIGGQVLGSKLGSKLLGKKGALIGGALGMSAGEGDMSLSNMGTNLAINYGLNKTGSLFKSKTAGIAGKSMVGGALKEGLTNKGTELASSAQNNFAEYTKTVSNKASLAFSRLKEIGGSVKGVGSMVGGALSEGMMQKATQMLNSVKDGLKSVFNKLGSLIPGKGSKEGVIKFCQNIITKISQPQILKKVAAKAAKTAAASVPILGVAIGGAFVIKGFYSGYNKAAETFDIPEDSVTMGMKVISGVAEAVAAVPYLDIFLMAISLTNDVNPTKEIAKLLSETIGPALSAGPDDIKNAKKKNEEENKQGYKVVSDAYQASQDMQDETMKQIQSVSSSVIGAAGQEATDLAQSSMESYASTVSDTAYKAFDFVKEKAGQVGKWLKDAAKSGGQMVSSAIQKAKDIGTSIKDKASKVWNGFFGKGKEDGNIFNSIIMDEYGRGTDPLNISQLDPKLSGVNLKVNGDSNKETIGTRGCVPASVMNAMASANPAKFQSAISGQKDKYSFASKFSNDSAHQFGKANDGIEGNGTARMAQKYGYTVKPVPKNIDDLKKAASEKGTAISVVSRSNGKSSSNNLFGSGGGAHAVTLTDYNPKTNKFTVNDPQGISKGLWDADKVLSSNKIISANQISDKKHGRGKFGRGIYGRGENAVKFLWDYFTENGYTPEAAAGILGNWKRESGVNPHTLEANYLAGETEVNKAFSSPEAMDEYTRKYIFPSGVNESGYQGEDGHLHPGMGLAQWTGPRSIALSNIAKSLNKSPGDIDSQIHLFNEEMNGSYSSVKTEINQASTPESAATSFLHNFEGIDDGTGPERASWARKIFDAKGQGIESADIDGNITSIPGNSSNGSKKEENTGILGGLSKIAQIFADAFNPFSSSKTNNNGKTTGSSSSSGSIPIGSGSCQEAMQKGLNGAEITGNYRDDRGNHYHGGLDFAISEGTPVPTPVDGVVEENFNDANGYGLATEIKDSKGYHHIFAHGSDNQVVKEGDSVKAGQIVLKSGNSGHSSGAHLHYGIMSPDNPGGCSPKNIQDLDGGRTTDPASYPSDGSNGRGKFFGRGISDLILGADNQNTDNIEETKDDNTKEEKDTKTTVSTNTTTSANNEGNLISRLTSMAEKVASPFKSAMAKLFGAAGTAFKNSGLFQNASMIFGDSLGGLASLFGFGSSNGGSTGGTIGLGGTEAGKKIVETAQSYLPTLGGSGHYSQADGERENPDGGTSDCSGFVNSIYRKVFGEQATQNGFSGNGDAQMSSIPGEKFDDDNKATPGDVVFMSTTFGDNNPSALNSNVCDHVGIVEDGPGHKMIDIGSSTTGLTERSWDDSWITGHKFVHPNILDQTSTQGKGKIASINQVLKTNQPFNENSINSYEDAINMINSNGIDISSIPDYNIPQITDSTDVIRAKVKAILKKDGSRGRGKFRKSSEAFDNLQNTLFGNIFNSIPKLSYNNEDRFNFDKFTKQPSPFIRNKNTESSVTKEAKIDNGQNVKSYQEAMNLIESRGIDVANIPEYNVPQETDDTSVLRSKLKIIFRDTKPAKNNSPTENRSNPENKAKTEKQFDIGVEGSNGKGPNGKVYTNNDILYLLKQGYTKEQAIEMLSKDKKYTEEDKSGTKNSKDVNNSIKKAQDETKFDLGKEGSNGKGPNGKAYTNNDILYLLNKGYTKEQAIEMLSKDKKYTEEDTKQTDTGENKTTENKDNQNKAAAITTNKDSNPETAKSKNIEEKSVGTEALLAEQKKTNELLQTLVAIATKFVGGDVDSKIAKESTFKTKQNNITQSQDKSDRNHNDIINMASRMLSGLPNGNVDVNFINPDLSRSLDVIKRMDAIVSR